MPRLVKLNCRASVMMAFDLLYFTDTTERGPNYQRAGGDAVVFSIVQETGMTVPKTGLAHIPGRV
jgi:hypothetical protein